MARVKNPAKNGVRSVVEVRYRCIKGKHMLVEEKRFYRGERSIRVEISPPKRCVNKECSTCRALQHKAHAAARAAAHTEIAA